MLFNLVLSQTYQKQVKSEEKWTQWTFSSNIRRENAKHKLLFQMDRGDEWKWTENFLYRFALGAVNKK